MSVTVIYKRPRDFVGPDAPSLTYASGDEEPKVYNSGDEISMSVEERARLAQWFIFEDKKSGDVVEPDPAKIPAGVPGPSTTVPIDQSTPTSTSGATETRG